MADTEGPGFEPLSFAELAAAFSPGAPRRPRDAACLARVRQLIARTVRSRRGGLDREQSLELRAHVEFKLLEYLRDHELRDDPLKFRDDGRRSYAPWVCRFTRCRVADVYSAPGPDEEPFDDADDESTSDGGCPWPDEEVHVKHVLEHLPQPHRGVAKDTLKGFSRQESASRRCISLVRLDQLRRELREMLRTLLELWP